MKRLWKYIPPCFSDVLGFEAVVNETNGFGIVDDPSRYKPLRLDGKRDAHGPHGEGRFHGEGGPHGGDRRNAGVRVANSDIRNADIIRGTQQKVLEAFDSNVSFYHPDFVLLSYAPSSSMIGSDLDAAAEIIGERSGLPTACVGVHGDKDYLYGVSCTLETMGKLLLKEQETIPNTVNLLGCDTLDWAKETLEAVEELLTGAGWTVLSRWGAKEATENLKKASAASVNLVVTAGGFRLARYMEAEFGIPYVAGAPFGNGQWAALLEALRGAAMEKEPAASGEPEALVIGEQLTANAIRQALRQRGIQNVQVASFYEMEKSRMEPGDQKLSGEDDLAQKLQQPSIRLVFGDPDCKAVSPREVSWIGLPNGGNQSPVNPIPNFNMAGAALDQWLDDALRNRSAL